MINMKWKVLLFALLFPTLVSAQSFPSTSILDNFNRANEDPIAGIWTNGLSGTGQCEVLSNQIHGSSGTDTCYTTATYDEDQEVFITWPNLSTLNQDANVFIYLCIQPTDIGSVNWDGYGVRVRRVTAGNDLIRLVRITNDSVTNLGTGWSAGEFGDGWKTGVRRETGGTFTLYIDQGSGWAQEDQITGETFYSCDTTHLGYEGTQVSSEGDDFGGGDVVSAGPDNPVMMILEAK